jgi:hypothetical protein
MQVVRMKADLECHEYAIRLQIRYINLYNGIQAGTEGRLD